MKYAHINNDGKLLGWYDDEIHNDIPTPNIEISDDVWQNAINNNHNKINIDGTTELFDFRTDAEKAADDIITQLHAAHSYLNSTDFKMTIDYFATLTDTERDDLTNSRAAAREFIRLNEMK